MSIPAAGNFLWIVPKTYYERVGFDEFVRQPVGSGPYELVEFRNADSVTYKKRADAHAFRKPIADELTYRVIGENSQIINGLRTGETDIAADVNFTAEQAESLKRAAIDLHVGLNTLQYLALPQGVAELRNTPFRDKRVRQALWYAINREDLANTLYRGYAKPAISVAVPGTPYFDPAIPVPAYDPNRAKQMLAAAGYPNGFRLPVGLDYNTAFTTQDVVVAIQANLRAIGLEFEVTPNERAVAVDKAYGRNNLQKGDIWVARQGDPMGFGGSRTFIGCGKPVGDPSALYWCNEEWDRLMDSAYAEKNEQRRAEILKQAARLQADEAVYQALYVEPLFTANRENVRGVSLVHPQYFNFDSAYKIG
jgi:ABC-type transport system substrate-binding protein